MDNKINITVPEGHEGKIVLEILEGAAASPIETAGFSFSGDIQAASAFLIGKKTPAEKVIVLFDSELKTIEAIINYDTSVKAKISGWLVDSDVLQNFGINKDKKFSLDQLRKLIRLNAPWFANSEEHQTMMVKLAEFRASTQADVTNQKDNRGNHNLAVNKKVNSDVPFSFVLAAPIFKGTNKVTFSVDVCLDVTDGGVVFWMESSQLTILTQDETNARFEIEYQKISKAGYTIIVKS